MFYCYKLDSDNNLHINFADLLKKALGLLGAKKKLVNLVWIDKKSDQIEDLVDKCKKKTQISSAANYSTILPESALQPLIVTFIPTTFSGVANSWPINKKIDQLIEVMQSLALFVCTLQEKTGISGGNPRAVIATFNSDSFQLSGFTST